MTTHISCEQFADTVSDLLEREVSETTRAAMERHALECVECGMLLADLRKLRIDATNLPELMPSRDLWSGIAARIDAPVIPLPSAHRVAQDTRLFTNPRWRWVRYAAAAAVLIAATATTTYYLTTAGEEKAQHVATTASTSQAAPVGMDSSSAPSTIVAAVDDSGRVSTSAPPRTTSFPTPESATARARAQLASTRFAAEQVYGNEIARLRTLVERRRSQLDPVTVSVIERNLRVIDEAIGQCRQALAKDPASRFLMESLNKALETKVELLRTAAMLPPRA